MGPQLAIIESATEQLCYSSAMAGTEWSEGVSAQADRTQPTGLNSTKQGPLCRHWVCGTAYKGRPRAKTGDEIAWEGATKKGRGRERGVPGIARME